LVYHTTLETIAIILAIKRQNKAAIIVKFLSVLGPGVLALEKKSANINNHIPNTILKIIKLISNKIAFRQLKKSLIKQQEKAFLSL
jgi:hypothetical protein